MTGVRFARDRDRRIESGECSRGWGVMETAAKRLSSMHTYAKLTAVALLKVWEAYTNLLAATRALDQMRQRAVCVWVGFAFGTIAPARLFTAARAPDES